MGWPCQTHTRALTQASSLCFLLRLPPLSPARRRRFRPPLVKKLPPIFSSPSPLQNPVHGSHFHLDSVVIDRRKARLCSSFSGELRQGWQLRRVYSCSPHFPLPCYVFVFLIRGQIGGSPNSVFFWDFRWAITINAVKAARCSSSSFRRRIYLWRPRLASMEARRVAAAV